MDRPCVKVIFFFVSHVYLFGPGVSSNMAHNYVDKWAGKVMRSFLETSFWLLVGPALVIEFALILQIRWKVDYTEICSSKVRNVTQRSNSITKENYDFIIEDVKQLSFQEERFAVLQKSIAMSFKVP